MDNIQTRGCEDLSACVISDFIDLPIHIVDNKGIVVFVNHAWVNTYKLEKTEAIGKPIEELMKNQLKYFMSINKKNNLLSNKSEYDYTYYRNYSTKSAATEVLQKKEKVSMVTLSLDQRNIVVTSTPIFDANNEITYVFTFIQDLSKTSELKEKLENEIQKNKALLSKLKYYKENKRDSKLIGDSKSIREIRSLIPVVSVTDASILILGESGVGKEVVAKEIYSNSERSDKPFMTLNCAAIPENLLESEMFGYEKGAFTGAVKSKEGLFEVANGGTLLLDEIGSMPLQLQPKLLRVLQENEFMRVGGTKKISLDVRIISATNENLLNMVKSGKFRSDLFYRLNVIPIRIPPLKDRIEDIKFLAVEFLDKYNEKYGKNKTLDEKALLALEHHNWPGNVRELKNSIERLVIIGDQNVITSNQVQYITHPNDINGSFENDIVTSEINDEMPLKEAVCAFERKIIYNALKKYKTTYNAAEALKTTQPTIARKAKAYGIIKDWD
jgi:transcriptional regulator with PAS, ATPase and Fis domain